MRARTLAVPVALLLVWLAGWRGEAMNDAREQFAIYTSGSPAPLYEPNAQWQAFVERGKLTSALVREEDIEAYDWDNQALILTTEASRRIHSVDGPVIVVLGERRLYGLRGLRRISAMGVSQPVVYAEQAEGRTVLLLRPYHDFGRQSAPADPRWSAIMLPEVRAHFERLHKLRLPRAEAAFRALDDSVARITVRSARATERGLELAYVLSGRRAGSYDVAESVSLTWGQFGASFGPTNEQTVSLAAGDNERKAFFPFSVLAKYAQYRDSGSLARGTAAEMPEPAWLLSIRIRPILTGREKAALGLVERLRLEPNSGWLSPLEDHQSAEVPLDWTRIAH